MSLLRNFFGSFWLLYHPGIIHVSSIAWHTCVGSRSISLLTPSLLRLAPEHFKNAGPQSFSSLYESQKHNEDSGMKSAYCHHLSLPNTLTWKYTETTIRILTYHSKHRLSLPLIVFPSFKKRLIIHENLQLVTEQIMLSTQQSWQGSVKPTFSSRHCEITLRFNPVSKPFFAQYLESLVRVSVVCLTISISCTLEHCPHSPQWTMFALSACRASSSLS